MRFLWLKTYGKFLFRLIRVLVICDPFESCVVALFSFPIRPGCSFIRDEL